MQKWSQQFKIVYKKYFDLMRTKGVDDREITEKSMSLFLGISTGKGEAWKRGQWPSALDCWNISQKLGLSLAWLSSGEGDPEGVDVPLPSSSTGDTPPPPVPMIGFASCSVQGVGAVTPFAVAVSPIAFSPRTVAVVASGESMVPAGIANGHICYCDPDQTPMQGEAVFFRLTDGMGSLKVYQGPGTRDGSHAFQGWLPANGDGKRKKWVMDVEGEQILTIAPVIFVRRRL